ncbi:unnamed protein product [Didymodactylos carnosus]|uniref:Glycogen [starch] synthase n=1 Tax=Didymodactylos carnosus TaxID=1234261 RepID=A0A8S2LN41_9BILA|nr:unnamed protein product [Didymodactylos carnosus]CAF3911708.1 unnamed protein product [Didymodactylos carnosus]
MTEKRPRFEILPVSEITEQSSITMPIDTSVDIVNENPILSPPPPAPLLPPSIPSSSSLRTRRTLNLSTYLKKKSLYNSRKFSTVASFDLPDLKTYYPVDEPLLHKPLLCLNSLSVVDSKETNNVVDTKQSLPSDDTDLLSMSATEYDPYATTHSSQTQDDTCKITNKFLNELRRKGRELRERRNNMPIDQRILQHKSHQLRAQDIFDVHFGIDDYGTKEVTWGWNIDPSDEYNQQIKTPHIYDYNLNNIVKVPLLYDEKVQQQIKADIYDELNRQRNKTLYKQHRHIFVGRVLFILVSSFFGFMAFTLIYVVSSLYNRADYAKLPDNEGDKAKQMGKWLLEISWEIANKVTGIYKVIRSKVPITKKEYGNNFICIGPYNDSFVKSEVEICEPRMNVVKAVVNDMKRYGVHVVTGNWLIEGLPQVVLFDTGSAADRLDGWRSDFFEYARIQIPYHDKEANDAVIFGFCVFWFIGIFLKKLKFYKRRYVIAHFHEWLAGVGLIMARLRGYDCALVFTTHGTLLGKCLCGSSTDFYNRLDSFNSDKEAGDRQIYHRYCIERAAASCAHVFTTVSGITGIESEFLLNKKPDLLTPNGLIEQRFAALHEFQNLHAQNKEKLHAFVRGHFYGHYDFDLDKTLYCFITGQYEFFNKGVDMFIESLAKLNDMLKSLGSDMTIIAFLIFPTATNNFNIESLRGQSIAKMLRDTVQNVQSEIGKPLYEVCLKGCVPSADEILHTEDMIELKKCVLASEVQILSIIAVYCLFTIQ